MATDGLSKAEILRLCVLEMRGLREDLKEAGLLPVVAESGEAKQRPTLRLVKSGREEA